MKRTKNQGIFYERDPSGRPGRACFWRAPTRQGRGPSCATVCINVAARPYASGAGVRWGEGGRFSSYPGQCAPTNGRNPPGGREGRACGAPLRVRGGGSGRVEVVLVHGLYFGAYIGTVGAPRRGARKKHRLYGRNSNHPYANYVQSD